MPKKIVIADTSCLIVLSKVNALNLLPSLYKAIVVTPEVAAEYNEELPAWIDIVKTTNSKIQLDLEKQLDLGEASSIALALELMDSLLIVDDLRARKKIMSLNLEFTGTLGVLVKCKKEGIIPFVKPFLNKLKHIRFRMSSHVEEDILRQCNEL